MRQSRTVVVTGEVPMIESAIRWLAVYVFVSTLFNIVGSVLLIYMLWR